MTSPSSISVSLSASLKARDTNDDDSDLYLFPSEVFQILPPDPAEDYDGLGAVIAGWGETSWKGTASDILLKVTLLNSHWSRANRVLL